MLPRDDHPFDPTPFRPATDPSGVPASAVHYPPDHHDRTDRDEGSPSWQEPVTQPVRADPPWTDPNYGHPVYRTPQAAPEEAEPEPEYAEDVYTPPAEPAGYHETATSEGQHDNVVVEDTVEEEPTAEHFAGAHRYPENAVEAVADAPLVHRPEDAVDTDESEGSAESTESAESVEDTDGSDDTTPADEPAVLEEETVTTTDEAPAQFEAATTEPVPVPDPATEPGHVDPNVVAAVAAADVVGPPPAVQPDVEERAEETKVPPMGAPGSADEFTERLLAGADTDTLKRRWREVQATFVDDPQESMRQADDLISELIGTLTERLNARREEISAGSLDTEQLRVTLRRARGLFERMLEV